MAALVSLKTWYSDVIRADRPSRDTTQSLNSLEFFLNGAELSLNSVNSEKLINHGSMNWAQFKDPISHMGLAGTVVASWSLTQEMAGWQV